MAKRTKVTKNGEGGKPTFLDKKKKGKPVKSEFGEWFELQFGKRPSSEPLHVLRETVGRCRYELFKAEGLLVEAQLWDHRKTASMYAWTAREAILNEKGKGSCPENKSSDGT